MKKPAERWCDECGVVWGENDWFCWQYKKM